MNCAICNNPLRQVGFGGSSTTLMSYGLGACGRVHDDNCRKRVYTCCNQHDVVLSKRNTCECGWRGVDHCFCHDGLKLDKWPEEQ